MTDESPCSPNTYEFIERVDILKYRDNMIFKRAESNIVPVPITRFVGNLDNFCANMTITSNGLVTIIIFTFLESTLAITRGIISEITIAFLCNKSIRVSPGF